MTKTSKAAKIRRMHNSEGRSVKGIAKRLGIRYQHVYNVVHRMPSKA